MKEEVFLIDLKLDFGNFYKFATNFYLGENFLNFSFLWNDMEDYYNLMIFSDNVVIWEGVLRFNYIMPNFFGFRTEKENLKPKGKFVFLPKNANRYQAEANMRIMDFKNLNFELFFIKT
jgi:hypothetical protein